MIVSMLGTGGPSGVPLIVVGLIGLVAAVGGLVRAGRSPNRSTRVAGIVLSIVLGIVMGILLFLGSVVETLSNDPPL